MGIIAIPSSVLRWPRAALATVTMLAVALAVTVALAMVNAGHAATRTVIEPTSAVEQVPPACHWGRPC